MTADAPTLLATGRIVGHAPSTAAFIRAQHARGVSVETLRRQLGIKPEHMVGMVPAVMAKAPARAVPAVAEPPRPLATPLPPVAIPAGPTRATVLAVAASVTGVPVAMLRGRRGQATITRPRQFACWLLRTRLALSYPAIGQALGGKDHTTAMHGVSKTTERLDDGNPEVTRWRDEALARLAP